PGQCRRHLNTSTPPRAAPSARLNQALAGVEAGAGWWASLAQAASGLPHDADEARALAVFDTLRPLRADIEVLAAACLHLWPALRAALPKAALEQAPRVKLL